MNQIHQQQTTFCFPFSFSPFSFSSSYVSSAQNFPLPLLYASSAKFSTIYEVKAGGKGKDRQKHLHNIQEMITGMQFQQTSVSPNEVTCLIILPDFEVPPDTEEKSGQLPHDSS